MPATSRADQWEDSPPARPSGLQPPLRCQRVFPGHPRELAALRHWVASLLPPCPARDDVTLVASELSTNAIQHSLSGRGGSFAVEIAWHGPVVRIAVADGGGPSEPQVINDPAGEQGRGLLAVQNLSLRTGVCGDHRGRLIWAECGWHGPGAATALDRCESAIRDGQAALTRRFAGVPVWFGCSTLAWWALAPAGLLTAPTAGEMATVLDGLLNAPLPPHATPVPARAHPAKPPKPHATISPRCCRPSIPGSS